MNTQNRDKEILKHIMTYCEYIQKTVLRFGDNIETFKKDLAYKHACTMCILQIGELAKHLSEEFCKANNKIPWGSIKGMRNVFAHNYGNIDLNDTWDTIKYDIPMLKEFCQKALLSQNKSRHR